MTPDFFAYSLIVKGKVAYRNSWGTDFYVTKDKVTDLVKGGRAHWKIENEGFNTLKNQGYHVEHNFGHDNKNLSIKFFILNLLAYYVHQILQLTDRLYQQYQATFSFRKEFWNQLRCTFRIIVFKNLEHMLSYIYDTPEIRPPSNINFDKIIFPCTNGLDIALDSYLLLKGVKTI